MKLLLYCTKGKPYLYHRVENCYIYDTMKRVDLGYEIENYIDSELKKEYKDNCLNGKIVAECDFELKEIRPFFHWCRQLETATCLTYEEVLDYLDSKDKSKGNPKRQGIAYLIYIHNLHIFDEPKELSEYSTKENKNSIFLKNITKAPQNMMYCFEKHIYILRFSPRIEKHYKTKEVLISIHPEWLCKILNGEKTIEIRKKVLKEMLK